MRSLLIVLLLALCVSPAEARRWRGGSAVTGSYAMPEAIDPVLQPIAQARANRMAELGVLSHSIGGCPSWAGHGVGEGIGCSTASDPKTVATCIVGSTVVADAWAKSSNGMLYRVRFFK